MNVQNQIEFNFFLMIFCVFWQIFFYKTQKKPTSETEAGLGGIQTVLFLGPVSLAGVIKGEFLAGDMAVETEHVA